MKSHRSTSLHSNLKGASAETSASSFFSATSRLLHTSTGKGVDMPIQRQQISEEANPLHSKFEAIQRRENKTGLPDNLKSGIESLSGYAMDDVKVHYNSPKPAQLHAHAYAQGSQIHIAPGQEKHLPHEAWHVVQQKQGRVKATTQMKGKVKINDDVHLEREADVMGKKVISSQQETEGSLHRSYPSRMATNQRIVQRYTISGGDSAALAEEKSASVAEPGPLVFTKFTSCIGVVGRKGGSIVGVHLVRVGGDGKGPDVASIKTALDGITDGVMFGFLENWEGSIKSEIASSLDILDWRPMAENASWKISWVGGDWTFEKA